MLNVLANQIEEQTSKKKNCADVLSVFEQKNSKRYLYLRQGYGVEGWKVSQPYTHSSVNIPQKFIQTRMVALDH